VCSTWFEALLTDHLDLPSYGVSHLWRSGSEWQTSSTFLDTPGHAAFSGARERGARVTDIVILVVAADSSVQPQTIDAIRAARSAGVPIVVAITKMDARGANPEKVKRICSNNASWSRRTAGISSCIEVSATAAIADPTKGNLSQLVEALALQAEMMELRARVDGPALAAVIDARADKGRGPVATVLVRQGRLRKGAHVVVGSTWGRVRHVADLKGAPVAAGVAGRAVEISGLRDVPTAGDIVEQVFSGLTCHGPRYQCMKKRGSRVMPGAWPDILYIEIYNNR